MRGFPLPPRVVAAWLIALAVAAPAAAQTGGSDLLNPSPRGLTDVPPPVPRAPAAAPATLPAAPGAVPAAASPAGPAAPPAVTASPLPPDPALAARPLVFGSQMFTGRFATTSFSGFNADYQIAVGDRVTVRLWGAYAFEATQAVDAQGNVFLPNVGPVRVLGVRNAELNRIVESQVKRVFRANV
ncbi:MAG: polysaccharide biosynthesis/export family protein, partial [Rubrivivax sp.]|nr:polysaccharide biosynthesis/export family protein [Rubrivivax sp.]